VPRLYEEAVRFDHAIISDSGGLATFSGSKTGRSPKDKRIVDQPSVHNDVWWGKVNIPMGENAYRQVRQTAVAYLENCDHLYVFDGFAGWDPDHRIRVRVICSRAYHALFMHNMLIRPTEDELEHFGTPDFVIYNAGQKPVDLTIET
jgi:phosphoenolpyruvate carboxykinase (ATP)